MSLPHELARHGPASRQAQREHLASLLARAADGDVDAFMSFYDHTSSTVHALALARCADRRHAEDLTCSAYACAWANVTEHAASGLSPLAWLLTWLARPPVSRRAQGVEGACA